MDKDSEEPKIYSSLTENQAAVIEYICQVWVLTILSSFCDNALMLKMFSERAALLVSLTIATFLNRMGRQTESVVAVTGEMTVWWLKKALESI